MLLFCIHCQLPTQKVNIDFGSSFINKFNKAVMQIDALSCEGFGRIQNKTLYKMYGVELSKG